MQQVQNNQWQEAVQHLLAVRRPEQAEQLVRRHLAQHPRDAFAHVLLALALLRQDRLWESREAAELAIILDPMESEAYYLLSLAQANAGNSTPAEEAIRLALGLNPTCSKYLGTRAWLLNVLYQPKEAQKVAKSGLKHDPTHQESLIQLAYSLRTQQRWEALGTALQRLIKAHPQLPVAHRLLGQEALRQEYYPAAQAYFEDALRLDPDDPYAQNRLMQAIRYQFRPSRLIYCINHYKELIPTYTQQGKWRHLLLFLLMFPIAFLCIPILLFVGFEALYWRLHPKIRQLRSRPEGNRSYLRETLYRYGAVASVQLLILAFLPILIWGILWLGLPKNSLGPVLTGGLTTLIMAMGQVLKETAAMPAPEKSPLGWVLLAVLYLAGTITVAFWPTFGPWEALAVLSGNALLLYWRFRTLRQQPIISAAQ